MPGQSAIGTTTARILGFFTDPFTFEHVPE